MSKKYRILVESTPVMGHTRHAFIVLQYADENGSFSTDPYEDQNAIIYRAGPALMREESRFEVVSENYVNELNAFSTPDDDRSGEGVFGNTVVHIGAFNKSFDYGKFYSDHMIKEEQFKEEGKASPPPPPLHKIYEGDTSINAEVILNELALRFAGNNNSYHPTPNINDSFTNSNTFVAWVLKQTLEQIKTQGGDVSDIDAIVQEADDIMGTLPGYDHYDDFTIDMSTSLEQIKKDLTLATIIRNYFPEESKALYDLKLKLDEINNDPWGAAGVYDSYKQMLQLNIDKLQTDLDQKVAAFNLWGGKVLPFIENPSQEHDLDLSSWYEIQGGTNSNNFFDIHVNFSHGTAGSEQKSESETIQSVINDGLIYHWGGTTISSSTVNEPGFWAEINAAISDGFQPGRDNVINSTASDQVKNYYWQAEGLEDSVYLNSFGYISNFSQHLEEIDPMILDLDGDGVELTSFNNHYIFFDIDNDGYLERTGWVGADDGMLVHDLNGDGIINDMTEVMSEYYGAAKGTGMIWSSAFSALASLDSNRDGVINDQDINFAALQIWQDANQNGICDAGELKSLADLNIKEFSLSKTSDGSFTSGNEVKYRGHYTLENGQVAAMAAVNFIADPNGVLQQDDDTGKKLDLEDGGSTYGITSSSGETVSASDKNVSNITGGDGDDVLTGDDQDNWLVGSKGKDQLFGGGGNDYLVADAEDIKNGQDGISGGDGYDIIQFVGDKGVRFNLQQSQVEMAIGTDQADTLISGSSDQSIINGGAGSDTIYGGSNSDVLNGEEGDDQIYGRGGNDLLRGHRGDDILSGGDGDDIMEGGLGSDTLFGGRGEDMLHGGLGDDILSGGEGYDVARYDGSYSDYKITRASDNQYIVEDLRDGSPDGTDILIDVEAISFSDINEIRLDGENPMPVKDVIRATAEEDGKTYRISITDLLANDLDYQGDSLSLREVFNVKGGTANIEEGEIVFILDDGFIGVPTFSYHIEDEKGNFGQRVGIIGKDQTAEMSGKVSLLLEHHPDDPQFLDQWYLHDTNILAAWQDYSGKGIKVAISEPGPWDAENYGKIDYSHPDLIPNIDAESLRLQNPNIEPTAHATLVAGIIGAAKNDIGSIGVAYDATLFNEGLCEGDLSAMNNWDKYDIINNSWGIEESFKNLAQVNGEFIFDGKIADLYFLEKAANYGRDDLGSILVFAGGNDRQIGGDTNAKSFTNSRYSITVGAVNAEGDLGNLQIAKDPFSNPGASILVSAPGSNITSTSRLVENDNGSTFGSDYEQSQGTSFAAPIASGVVALMLEANPNLGWRDVQEILALSAKKIDDPNTSWSYNNGSTWNGGGMHYSHDYGFGMIDAKAAVRLAETWRFQNTSYNEAHVFHKSGDINQAIADGEGELSHVITITDDIQIENIEVIFDLEHEQMGDLEIILTAPDGTQSILVNRPGVSPDAQTSRGQGSFDRSWQTTTTNHLGESSVGDWTLTIRDKVTGQTGELHNWELWLHGKNHQNNIYVYTSEFAQIDDEDRAVLSDKQGYEAINTSAIDDNVTIDLRPSHDSIIAGKSVKIQEHTIIEEAFTGDGNDTIYGNDAANVLSGGRGNDIIESGKGNDTIDGGLGDDHLEGGAGDDTIAGGLGDDVFYYSKGDGNDVIHDLLSKNKLIFNDMNASDILEIERKNDDAILHLSTGDTITLKGQFILSTIKEIHFADEDLWIEQYIWDDAIIKGSEQPDYVKGTDDDDNIESFAGHDILKGGKGDDTYYYSKYDGHNVIIDNDGVNSIVFRDLYTSDIEKITYEGPEGEDVVIHFKGFDGSIRIIDQGKTPYSGENRPISKIIFADDHVWLAYHYQDGIGTGANYYYDGSPADPKITSMQREFETLDETVNTATVISEDMLKGSVTSTFWIDTDKVIFQDFTSDQIQMVRYVDNYGEDIKVLYLYIADYKIILKSVDENKTHQDWQIKTIEFADGEIWDTDKYTSNDIYKLDVEKQMEKLDTNSANKIQEHDSSRDDTYYYSKDDDRNLEIWYPRYYSDEDCLIFKDLMLEDVIFESYDDNRNYIRDLVIHIKETGRTVTVKDYFRYTEEILIIEFANGNTLSREDIKPLLTRVSTDLDDIIIASRSDETLEGGRGNDTINGGGGDDTFIYTKGDGNDIITASWYSDTILMLKDINPQDVHLLKSGYSLYVYILPHDDVIDIEHTDYTHTITAYGSIRLDQFFYDNSSYITFDDGTIWSKSTIEDKLITEEERQEIIEQLEVPQNIFNVSSIASTDVQKLAYDHDGNIFIYLSDEEQPITLKQAYLMSDIHIQFSDILWNDDAIRDKVALYGSDQDDILVGSNADDKIITGDGHDRISARDGNDIIDAGLGDDYIDVGKGDNVIIYRKGDGSDIIECPLSVNNALKLIDIYQEDISLCREVYGNLMLYIKDTDDVITIANYFHSGYLNIQFSDNTTWSLGDIYVRTPVLGLGTSGNDLIASKKNQANQVITGFEGDDIIFLSNGSQYSSDLNYYVSYSKGHGNDVIKGENGYLLFQDLYSYDITKVTQQYDDIILHLSTGNYLTLKQQIETHDRPIEQIIFADGETWDAGYFKSLSYIEGSNQSDWLDYSGFYGRFLAGKGDDIIHSGFDDDTYYYRKGDGSDIIFDSGGNNKFIFTDIKSSEISRIDYLNHSVILHIKDTQETITFVDFYADDPVEIKSASGPGSWGGISAGGSIIWTNNYYPTVSEIRFSDDVTWSSGFDNEGIYTLTDETGYAFFKGYTYTFNKGYGSLKIDAPFTNNESMIDFVENGNDVQVTSKFVHSSLALNNVSAKEIKDVYRLDNDLLVYINATNEHIYIDNYFTNISPVASFVFSDATWSYEKMSSKATIQQEEKERVQILGSRDDVIEIKEENEIIYAGRGNDTLKTTWKTPKGFELYGEDGDDVLSDSFGASDLLDGGKGDDILIGQGKLVGGLGNDIISIIGSNGTLIYNQGDGHDVIFYEEDYHHYDMYDNMNNNTIVINSNDTPKLYFTRFDSSEFHADSYYYFNSEYAKDLVIDFGGEESITFIDWDVDNFKTISFNNVIYTSQEFFELYLDAIRGTEEDDCLIGTSNHDYVYAYAGNDYIDTKSGDDTIYLAGGEKTVYGGRGDDHYILSDSTNQHVIINDEDGFDILEFETFDNLTGEFVDTQNDGIMGLKFSYNENNSVTILNWDQDSPHIIEGFSLGGEKYYSDDLLATLGLIEPIFYGTPGDDCLYGTIMDDEIYGEGGNDDIYGWDGDDKIYGGKGDDYLEGMDGDDTYYFDIGDGNDEIEDYSYYYYDYHTGSYSYSENNTIFFLFNQEDHDISINNEIYSDIIFYGNEGDSINFYKDYISSFEFLDASFTYDEFVLTFG